jgi:hypothetical protein
MIIADPAREHAATLRAIFDANDVLAEQLIGHGRCFLLAASRSSVHSPG